MTQTLAEQNLKLEHSHFKVRNSVLSFLSALKKKKKKDPLRLFLNFPSELTSVASLDTINVNKSTCFAIWQDGKIKH